MAWQATAKELQRAEASAKTLPDGDLQACFPDFTTGAFSGLPR
jgi:hypothetical protein